MEVHDPARESLTIEVASTREAIATASAQAEEWLQSHRPSVQTLNLLLIAIEEIIINCIDYGYRDDEVHTIRLVLLVDGEDLTITLIDDGHPFDPLAAPPPDLSRPVQDRPAGGLGIHILRQLSHQIHYERRDGLNQLTITQRLR